MTDRRNLLRLPAYSRRNVDYDYDRAGRVYGGRDTLMPIVPSAGFVVEF